MFGGKTKKKSVKKKSSKKKGLPIHLTFWAKHFEEFREKHPKLSFKEAMKKAKLTYAKSKHYEDYLKWKKNKNKK